jgi:tRNA (guanine37-N1)-methyltransferase
MRIDVVTIFPEFFDGPLHISIVGRALASGIVQVHCHDLRNWTSDPHRTVDDAPYGGGAGMVMKPEPFFAAVEELRGDGAPPVVAFTPCGVPLTQEKVQELAAVPHLILLCGRYEGIDQRVHEALVTDEISLGDYVLSGGELPALVLIDAIVRLLPGAVGNDQSPVTDSFSDGLLEHPHYTRPAVFRGMAVPDVLIRGNHAEVARWRRRMSLLRTLQRRPDLLAKVELSREDEKLLAEQN